MKKIFITLGILLGCASCAGNPIFPDIPLSVSPLLLANPISMVASAINNRLYVANSNNQVLWFDASFYILDITSPLNPTTIAVISIPNFSGQVLLDETRGFVYIPNRQSANNADTVDQVLRININEASPTFLTTDIFDSAANPFGGFFDGANSLYVAATQEALLYDVNSFPNYSSVNLQVTTNLGRELNADETREIMLSPSGLNVFVTNRVDNFLILNAAQFTPPAAPGITDLGTEPVDYIVTGNTSTRGIARDSTYLYVVDGSPNSLRVLTDLGLAPVVGAPVEIGVASLQVAQIPVGSNPSEVVVDELNRRAYVSNTDSDDVSVIDLDLFVEITRVSVSESLPAGVDAGDEPFGMALVNVGGVNVLYVANFNSNNITVIDADALVVVASFPPID